MSDPRDRRGSSGSFGPAFGGGRRPSSPPRGGFAEVLLERRGLIAGLMVIAFFVVVAIGSSGQEVTEDEQLDLTGVVQAAMIQAGLPSVEVQVEDWTVILYGRVASPELKEAATRVAQAQAEVIGVDNRLMVPEPEVEEDDEPEVPDLPAAQADLLLQARLSAAAAHSPIRFSSGGDRITEESVPTLDLIAGFLAMNPTVSVQIIGHTDSDGEAETNLELSTIRAEAVRTQLVARGAEPERLTTLGLGEADPISDNLTKEGKGRNRRIEFLVIPEGQTGLTRPSISLAEEIGGEPVEDDHVEADPVDDTPIPTTIPTG
ncbi:MAG: OmpA family protein [Acidimicrobiales bacterium]|nr:OmpA family protein [Acidimicrobiales bacterium]MDP6214762.1 OmpA family protein [Acidimicrobiales bacterium]MDP7208894.1 OmpA family protein [Acidimicrobiales bacterium]HJO99297.1 OmpA family protein [Acidimicrobiales bacterium]